MATHSIEHVLLHGQETTFGTAVTPDKTLGLRQNVSATYEHGSREVFTTGSAEAQDIVGGKVGIKNSVELIMQHARPLEYIFGTVAHDETTNDWKHTFSVADSLPSMTLEDSYEKGDTDSTSTYAGLKFTTATIGLAMDGNLTFRADGMSKDVANTTSASADSIDSISPLSDFEGSFKTGTLDSETAVAETQNFEITLNRNTKSQFGLGDREAEDIEGMNLNIDFTASVGFNNNDEIERLLGDTSIQNSTPPTGFGCEFIADNGTELGSGQHKFYLQLNSVQYKNITRTTPIGDYVMADLSGNGILEECYMVDSISDTNW